jgi:hypothetical protein
MIDSLVTDRDRARALFAEGVEEEEEAAEEAESEYSDEEVRAHDAVDSLPNAIE